MSNTPPGWYRDPAEPSTQRYWDGDGWLGDPLPADATPPDGPPPIKPPVVSAPPVTPGVPSGPPATGWQPPSSGAPGSPAPPSQPSSGVPAPGSVPPGQYHPGAYPPPPPGFPPGGYQPGQYPGQPYSAPPTGRMAPGTYRPHPGAVSPGQAPPGWPAGVPFPAGPYVLVPADPRPHGYALAPLGRRFVARLIDIFAVFILASLAGGLLVYRWAQETGPYWRAVWHNVQSGSGTTPAMTNRGSTLLVLIVLVIVVVWAAYEVPATGNSGQTIGKRVMGIRVIPLESVKPLGFGRAFARWTPLGLPTFAWFCLIGFVFQFVDSISPVFNQPLRLALHDRRAATVVVSLKGATPDATAADITAGGTS